MKLLLTVISVFSLLFVSSPQAEDPLTLSQGTQVIGGQAFFMSQNSGKLWENSDDNAFHTLAIEADLGYFVTDNFTLGGMLSTIRISQGDKSLAEFRIGPVLGYFFRTYKGNIQGEFIPFVKGFVLFESIDFGEHLDNVTYILYGGQLGSNYMITNSFAVNVSGQFHTTNSRTTIMFGIGIEKFFDIF